jgi:flagellin
MSFSVNTNKSALNALQQLNNTNRSLDTTQLRINTGFKVNNAKDNAAVFAIAQNLRSETRGLEAVKQSLDRSASVLDITLAAAEDIQDTLIQMKEKVVAAADAGLDQRSRDALRADFERLREQLRIIAQNANFNGTNLIDGPANPATNRPANLVALVSADAQLQISIPRQDLSLPTGAGPVTPGASIIEIGLTQTFTNATEANALIASVDNSIRSVSQSLTVFGAGAKSIENQRVFVDKLSDTLEGGIGNLVDADLARESARLQALQVKQQLGTQALSIANQRPQSILSLFGN